MPLIPALEGQTQDSKSYTDTPCLKEAKKKKLLIV